MTPVIRVIQRHTCHTCHTCHTNCHTCHTKRQMSYKKTNVMHVIQIKMSYESMSYKTLIVIQLSYKTPQNHSGGHSTRPHTILLYPTGLRDKISVNIALKNAEGHDTMHYMCTPITQHPAPSTQHPSPITHHPAPSTQHPAPCTHHPSPCTIPTTP
jgi:hypothetical protein